MESNSTNPPITFKPYLIRAFYEWISDSGNTPYIAVDTSIPRVSIPQQYIKNNSIVLDISGAAAHHLVMNNEAITFKARFGGIPYNIYIPIASISAIYAPETSQGTTFSKETLASSSLSSTATSSTTKTKKSLQIITGGKNQG